LTAGTWYLVCTSTPTCGSATVSNEVTVIVNNPAAPTGTASQTFCSINNPTVASLTATGTAIQWYAASSGGTALSTSTALTTGTHYYATQTVSSCESASRFDVTATVDTSPLAPAIATPHSASCSGFTAQWSWTANVTKYYLDVATDSGFTSIVSGYNDLDVGNVLSYAIIGLNPATTYYYRVRASGCSTSVSSATMSIATSSVAVPGTASPYSASCSGFTAQWSWTANATKYYLDVATDNGFTSIVSGYNNLDVGNVLSYAITGLSPATTYYYRVRASGCGTSVSSATMNYATSPTPSSIPVVIGTSNSNCSNGLQLDWNQVTNASGYYLDISTNSSFSSFVSGYNGYDVGYQTNSFYAGGLSSGIIYYYRIRAYNACGTTASSNVISFSISSIGGTASSDQTICSGTQPTDLTVANYSSSIIRWEKSNTLGFGSLTSISVASATLTGTVIGNLTSDAYFRAVAKNGSCAEVYSNVVKITVNSLPSTPTVGTITNINCTTSTGSIVLNDLPSGNWTINQAGTATASYTGSTASYTVTGLAAGNYTFTVTNANGCPSSATSSQSITDASSTTWNGSAWSNGSPTSLKAIVFNGNFSSTTDVEGCSCQVTGTAVVTINSGHTLKITNQVEVLGLGTLTFENNASLVQINDAAVNSGNINYKRYTAPVKRYDFTYWSSPVVGQTLKNLSPNTLGDKYYGYNPNTGWVIYYNGAATMVAGNGYLIRAPQTFSITVAAIDTNPVFIGKPNNGVFSFAIAGNKVHLLGNPYPSAMDADAFLDLNSTVLEGTLYFWTHNSAPSNAVAGTATYNYTTSDYATYNRTGGVSTALAAVTGGATPTGKIATGQGFFAPASTAGGTVVFNNSMRLSSVGALLDNSQFFKLSGTSKTTTSVVTKEKNRIWLNLTNKEGAFKQALVGYITGATNDYDGGFDGVTYDGNQFVDFYSVNNAVNLSIQGRALPFVKKDSVALGYKSTIKGNFQISIDHTDGALAKQNIFLEDKDLKVLHDLKKEPYTFSTEIGAFNSRFVLRYVDKNAIEEVVVEPEIPVEVLEPNQEEVLNKDVLVSVKNDVITINSDVELLDRIVVYDTAGRKIYEKNEIAANLFVIQYFVSSHQVLMVDIVLSNGTKVSRKIVY
jgi:hypothetical protein